MEVGDLKEKADQLFAEFAVYDWNERSGYENNIEKTKQKMFKVIDTVIEALEYTHFMEGEDEVGSIEYWNELKKYVFKNY